MITQPAENRFSPTPLSTSCVNYGRPAPWLAGLKDALDLPGYNLLAVLGRGGMAIVYKARQHSSNRLVAIKVIDGGLERDRETVARFHQEQSLGARLRHPNLIAQYQAGGDAAGRPYLVMEFVDGENLAGLVERHGPLPTAEACEATCQAAMGLQHLHEHGLIHRDIKPSNLMLTRSGHVKVLDLGLARDVHETKVSERITLHGQCLGTLDYTAPEQCLDAAVVDIRADIYSLGCSLYEFLTGQPPFAQPGCESAFQKMKAHIETPVPPLWARRPDAPAGLAGALNRMLAKDPKRRFSSPAGVAAALQPFAAGADLAALSASAPLRAAVPA